MSADWVAIRIAYEQGKDSLSALEREFGVSRQAIKKRAIREQWVTPPLRGAVPGKNQDTQKRDVNAAKRVVDALEMRVKKVPYTEIAARCGYGSAGAAYNAIQRELRRVIVQNVEDLRHEEELILDRLYTEVWELVIDKKSKGRLFAVDRVLAILERRAKLRGLDLSAKDSVAANMVVVREMPVGYLKEITS